MKHVIDGYEFSLSAGSKRIYVFKGDALVTVHDCQDAEEAKRVFRKIKTKKKIVGA
jgi:hypothetical protein